MRVHDPCSQSGYCDKATHNSYDPLAVSDLSFVFVSVLSSCRSLFLLILSSLSGLMLDSRPSTESSVIKSNLNV